MVTDVGVIVKTKFATICSVSVANFVGSAKLVAVTVTSRFGVDGRMPGALNTPPVVIVPQAAPAQPFPETVQTTLVSGTPPALVTFFVTAC